MSWPGSCGNCPWRCRMTWWRSRRFSTARGDWGVGSDLDIVVLVHAADLPFERRPMRYDSTELPVPSDVLVYTVEEWASAIDRPGLPRTAAAEAVWVYRREPSPA